VLKRKTVDSNVFTSQIGSFNYGLKNDLSFRYSKIDLISLGIHIYISHSLLFSNTFTVYTKEEEEEENHSKQCKNAAK
jgi:hypothetical protein